MQNDGGTIPSRTEILSFSLKKLKGSGADAGPGGGGATLEREWVLSQMLNTYRYCRLSKEVLAAPVVSDSSGYLYNKEKVLQYLLDRKKDGGIGRDVPTIGSLNDVVQLDIKLQGNRLTCPLSGTTLDIDHDGDLKLSDVQFCYIVPCGCTVNSNILRELVEDSEQDAADRKGAGAEAVKTCPVCFTPFTLSNIIDINPQDTAGQKRLQLRIDKLKTDGLYHNLKPRKTKKKRRSRCRRPAADRQGRWCQGQGRQEAKNAGLRWYWIVD